MMGTTGVECFRLKVLHILEGSGATVLRHVLKSGTRNACHLEFGQYLSSLSQDQKVYFTSLKDKDIGKLFSHSELEQIDGNFDWDFGLTLLFRCITLGCENLAPENDEKWKNPDELEGLITDMVVQRNQIMQKEEPLTDSEYVRKVNELKEVFVKTLKKVQERYNTSESNTALLEKRITSHVDRINLCSDPRELWKGKENRMLPLFKEQISAKLKELYAALEYHDPIVFLNACQKKNLPVENFFSEVKVKGDFGQADIDVDCLKVLNLTQQPCTTQQSVPLSEQMHARLLVLNGASGIGKTTFLNSMAYDWAKSSQTLQFKNLNSYDLVLQIDCSETNADTLEELVELFFPESVFYEPYTMALLRQCKVLFLIDGHEVNGTSQKLVIDIINHCIREPRFCIIYSTRPEAEKSFLCSAPKGLSRLVLHMEGIPRHDRIRFASMYYQYYLKSGETKDSECLGKLRDILEIAGSEDHFRLPYNLALLVILVKEAPSNLHEDFLQTSFYKTMHNWIIEKLQCTTAASKDTGTKKFKPVSSDSRTQNVLSKVYDIVLTGLLQGRLKLSEQETEMLKECCHDNDLSSDEVFGAFFITRKNYTNRSAKLYYCLPHKDVQDYLALHYIVRELCAKSHPGAIRTRLQNSLRKSRELLFSAVSELSLTEEPSLKWGTVEIADILRDTMGKQSEAWLDVLNRVKANEAFLHRVVHHIRNEVSTIHIDGPTVTSAKTLLPHLPPMEVNLRLRSEEHKLNGIHDVLKRHYCTLVFCLGYHRNPQNTEDSARVLRDIGNRCHISHFQGHLSAEDLSLLPSGLQMLSLSVSRNDHACSLLSALQEKIRAFPRLWRLNIHIPVPRVSASSLSPLPKGEFTVDLTLSDVNDTTIKTALSIIRSISPRQQRCNDISFPCASLKADGWMQILEGLAEVDTEEEGEEGYTIKVPDNIITKEEEEMLNTHATSLLGCRFMRLPLEHLFL